MATVGMTPFTASERRMTGFPRASTHTSGYLPSQLRVYLLAMMAVVGGGGVIALAARWLLNRDVLLVFLLGRVVLIALLALGCWLLARFPDGVKLHRLIDVAAPTMLSLAPTVALGRGALFLTIDLVLTAIAVSLCLRAALVPSSAWRTAIVGGLSLVPVLVVAYHSGTEARPAGYLLASTILWGVAILIATTSMSRVVHGLRRRLRLGPYELGRKLGEGGMGTVYEAKHALLRRPTAIKVIRGVASGSVAAKRFEREAQITSEISHPNVVSLFDYGCSPDGVYYYAMQLVDGLTLHEVVTRSGPLPPARAMHVLLQLAAALEVAHAADLVHRDIKPPNTMLCGSPGTEDLVKVLDFGLAKRLDAVDGITHGGAVLGTPTYLAPEVAWGDDAGSKAADVYAFGALAYYVLTGGPPFTGDTVAQVARAHAVDTPVPPSLRSPNEVPAAVDDLVLRCLAKAPEERFADGAELAAGLRCCKGVPEWTRFESEEWWRCTGARLVAERERRSPSEAPATEAGTVSDIPPTQHATLASTIPLLLERRVVGGVIAAEKIDSVSPGLLGQRSLRHSGRVTPV